MDNEYKPAQLAEFLILDDGSIGFSFKKEGLDVWLKNDIEPEKMLEMMHGLIQTAWEKSEPEGKTDVLN